MPTIAVPNTTAAHRRGIGAVIRIPYLRANFVTTFDTAYLARAVALSRSFARHNPSATLYLCCMDERAYRVMAELALPNTVALAHEAFAAPELAALRASRSVGEYCWTSKPYILGHIAALNRDSEWIVYIDTDMYVFGDLGAPLKRLMHLDGLLTPHHFSRPFGHYERSVGKYNAGYAAFRNTKRGLAALEEWRTLCTASCSAMPGEAGYGDQVYLNGLSEKWSMEAADMPLPGLNAAPWNIDGYHLEQGTGGPTVNGQPLLLYHFQGLRVLGRRVLDLYAGPHRLPEAARRWIYAPYGAELRRVLVDLSRRFPGDAPFSDSTPDLRGLMRIARRVLKGQANLSMSLA